MSKRDQNKDSNAKFNPNSPDYKARREAIQTEINSNKVNIDRSIFSKTKKEKAELKLAKKLFKSKSK